VNIPQNMDKIDLKKKQKNLQQIFPAQVPKKRTWSFTLATLGEQYSKCGHKKLN
jgi:hypothetical protein